MVLELGVNCGFVTEAPTGVPSTSTRDVDDVAWAMKVVAPAGATKVVEIGWYVLNNSGSENVGTDVAIYSHNAGDNNPEERLGVASFTTGTEVGWIKETVDISITGGTTYWIALQCDNATDIDMTSKSEGGEKSDRIISASSLPNPWGVSQWSTGILIGVYAVWEEAAPGTNMSINIGDVFKDVDSIQINIGDVWKDVIEVQQNIGDVWKTVF